MLWHRSKKRKKHSGKLQAQQRAPHLCLESLESRVLLDASFAPGIGALTLEASDDSDRIMIVAGVQDGDVIVRGIEGVDNGTIFSGVNQITIISKSGNDLVKVGPGIVDTSAQLIGVSINTGEGNNRVFGGDGDDTITSGSGNDKIHGGDGNDDIDAGDGNDQIRGGDGDDSISGGSGNDNIHGGGGNDDIDAGDGDDDVHGGNGNDMIDGY